MVKKHNKGDIIWLDFEPHSGHETGGHNLIKITSGVHV